MEKKTLSTRRMVVTALMAALTVAGSAIRVTMPLAIAGHTAFHLGNIMCALSGLLLGPWLGGFAAGLGSMIYDMTNPAYIADCWLTFIMKGGLGLVAGLIAFAGKKDWGYVKAIIATAAGAITYAVLYFAKTYFYTGMFKQQLEPGAAMLTVIGKIPATTFNAVVAVIFAPILGMAIRKALKSSHISF